MSNLDQEIEAYLNGEMTPDESLAFEKKLESSLTIRKEFELYREMNIVYNEQDWEITDVSNEHPKINQHLTFLKSKKGEILAESIKNAENQYFATNSIGNKKKYLYYISAAAAILIIGLFIASKLFTSPSHEHLYLAHKDWSDLPSLTIRNNTNKLASAEKLFKAQNYKAALDLFNKIEQENNTKSNWQVLIYKAIAQLEINQNTLAIENFKKLKQSNSLDAHKAYWYLALAYLKVNDITNAKSELIELTKHSEYYNHKSGVKLLKKLE